MTFQKKGKVKLIWKKFPVENYLEKKCNEKIRIRNNRAAVFLDMHTYYIHNKPTTTRKK